jgi:hypothetical protein
MSRAIGNQERDLNLRAQIKEQILSGFKTMGVIDSAISELNYQLIGTSGNPNKTPGPETEPHLPDGVLPLILEYLMQQNNVLVQFEERIAKIREHIS